MAKKPPLPSNDLKKLHADLRSLEGTNFTGVLVGYGSMILQFSNGSSVLVQCPFETCHDGAAGNGHGEEPKTALVLFDFFNAQVKTTLVDQAGRAELVFGSTSSIRIIMDDWGFDSYIVRAKKGVFSA